MAEDLVGDDSATVTEGRLKRLIKDALTETREVLPLLPDSWIRASGIAMMCSREEVLCSVEGLVREDTVGPDLGAIFAHGHALHHVVQNRILSKTDTLVGVWRCTGCGALVGGHPNEDTECTWRPEDSQDLLIPRPSKCTECDFNEFVYVELMVRDEENRIQGHPDGFLRMPELAGLGILEVKSIGSKGAWEVRNCPKLDHVIQAQCYMHLTGCRWAKILYWDKGASGMSAFVEHTIDYDADTVDKVMELIREIRDGIRRQKLPERICSDIDCPRAKECPVAEACFARDV